VDVHLAGPAGAPVAAILLHPHPHFGGDRHHPFVDGTFRRLAAIGCGAARFDFPSADPESATEAIRDALDVAAQRWPDRPVVLAGYSFGASMALRVSAPVVAGWFLVAPPEVTLGDAVVGDDPRPKRFLVPAHDQFSSPDSVGERVGSWTATSLDVIPGDHYLGSVLGSVIDACLAFIGQFA
jgi:alpha/beta superfamily hydrolase